MSDDRIQMAAIRALAQIQIDKDRRWIERSERELWLWGLALVAYYGFLAWYSF